MEDSFGGIDVRGHCDSEARGGKGQMKQGRMLIVLILCVLGHAISPGQSQKRFWISPASVRSDFWDMFKPGAKWDTLLSRTSVFSIHVNALGGRDTAAISQAIQKLTKAGVLINFECGGLRPFSGCDSLAGERHAQAELNNLSRWVSRGGRIDFITMDSPINTMIRGGDASGTCNWTVERTAHEMVDYMKAVRVYLPDVQFALVEPVPWYRVGSYPNQPGNNYGDLIKTLDTVLTIVESRGERIGIFHSDSPYGYSNNSQTQGWLKLKAVEEWLHKRGVRHGRINNSEQGGLQSNQLFYEQTIDSYVKYKASGGDPDEIEVWCWYDHPDLNEPETQPYTFTYTCKKLFELVEGAAKRTFAPLEPQDGKIYHGVGQSMTGVSEYFQAMGDSSIMPVVHNLYYDIPGVRGDKFAELRQTLESRRKIGIIPHLSIAMTDGRVWTDSIIATGNKYDYAIDSIAQIVSDFGRKIFVRPGFEFNGSWFPYHPYLYPVAFQKIVNTIRAKVPRDSVAFLWCYYPAGPNDFDSLDARGSRWYPGDGAVDWFSLDLFGAADFHPDSVEFKRGQITKKGKSERFLAMARLKGKPVFLSEVSAAYTNITASIADGQIDWHAWFAPFFTFAITHPEVKGFNYTNWDWSQYGQWKEWGDSRIEINPYILENYRREMRNPRYLNLRRAAITAIKNGGGLPAQFELSQNYPNPFNPATAISYQLTANSFVTLKVFDILGREVATLVNGVHSAGTHAAQWDGRNERGESVSSGVYLYVLTTPYQTQTRKMLVVR